ncbi:Pominin domain-containing protein [Spironucleus salmonicida]|uniref:Pominin domain-containing protein n=2 Tax=Spironucleus salmonicida TaxID=348837 RepID=A0A9P8LP19_9EUKA|nr:Pominin domain-containing protein [Spironucleus salmonicida]
MRNTYESLQASITTMEIQASTRDTMNNQYFPNIPTLILEEQPLEQFNKFAQNRVSTLDTDNAQLNNNITQLQQKLEHMVLQQKVTISELNAQIDELQDIVTSKTGEIKYIQREKECEIQALMNQLEECTNGLFAEQKNPNQADLANVLRRIKAKVNE